MALCELSGRGPVVKNLVSHSNIKTKSKAHCNIQRKSFKSLILGESTRFKISVRTLRDIEHRGGLDSYLLRQPNHLLSKKALKLKNRIQAKIKPLSKEGSNLNTAPGSENPKKALKMPNIEENRTFK